MLLPYILLGFLGCIAVYCITVAVLDKKKLTDIVRDMLKQNEDKDPVQAVWLKEFITVASGKGKLTVDFLDDNYQTMYRVDIEAEKLEDFEPGQLVPLEEIV